MALSDENKNKKSTRQKEREGKTRILLHACSRCLVSSLQCSVCVSVCVGETGLSSVACRTRFSLTKEQ